MNLEILPGLPYPLGANFDGNGINFALFSKNATRVQLCLFDHDGKNEKRIDLIRQSAKRRQFGHSLRRIHARSEGSWQRS